jgi:hypothetical protein
MSLVIETTIVYSIAEYFDITNHLMIDYKIIL